MGVNSDLTPVGNLRGVAKMTPSRSLAVMLSLSPLVVLFFALFRGSRWFLLMEVSFESFWIS